MPSAVIVRARLPSGLERLRRRLVGNAAEGVPAHLTFLHPFIEPASLDLPGRRRLAEVAARHAAFDYRQVRMAEWPEAIYVAVEPTEPFARLHRDLQAAFPAWPIYGADADFEFVPHITVADRLGRLEPGVREAAAWRSLPRAARAAAIEVIATDPEGRWRRVWRIRLGTVRSEPSDGRTGPLLASRP
jgi:2'-5' RNA ligase